MIRKLIPVAKKYSLYAILSPVCVALEVLIEVTIPFLMSVIVDSGIGTSTGQEVTYKLVSEMDNFVAGILAALGYGNVTGIDIIVPVGIIMICMAALSLTLGALAAKFSAMAGMGFGAELRSRMFESIQSFSFGNIDRFSTASLITRMTNDVNMIQMGFMMLVRVCVRAPFMLLCALVYAFSINKGLSLIFIIVTPLLLAVLLFAGSKAQPRFVKMFKKIDAFNSSVQENLIAIRVVKAFVRARHEKEKFEASNDELRDAATFAQKLMIMLNPAMSLAMYACIIAVLWLGSNMIVSGNMATGELISFISYVTQILMSLMTLAMIFIMYVMARAAITRVTDVLDEKPLISDESADASLLVASGNIEFREVSFKYGAQNEKTALSNINLSVRAGETVGIIGGTGSAKTTLVQLIPRLYDASGGEVLVGGRNVKEYTLNNLRDAVSMVLQNNVLFSGTIEENLRWGNEDASDEDIREAAKTAQAAAFIEGFPDGYDTWIEQGGVNVSGGQKQRLCIARALLKKPKILILDDSTSAVDTATDSKIREGFKLKIGDMTTLIIAQRISSVRHADMIIVLDDGMINGVGTHEELLRDNEIYREVYESQQEGSVA